MSRERDKRDMQIVASNRKPGRPKGSKNRPKDIVLSEQLLKTSKKKDSVGPGRPRGSKNKSGSKKSFRKPAKISYAKLYMNATGGARGSGTILELLTILENAITKHWTDKRVIEFFGNGHDNNQADDVENACHIYMSSKGRLVSDRNTLSVCVLFPGLKLSAKFLEHYIHSSTDLLTYGDFVTQTRTRLQKRARALLI